MVQTQTLTPLHALADEPIWCHWRAVIGDDGKATKIPYQPNGRRAKSDDPTTWRKLADLATKGFNGPAIMAPTDGCTLLIEGDGIAADGRINEADTQWADFIITASTYTEWSPSNTGHHVIIRTTEPLKLVSHQRPLGGDHHSYEVYNHGRFFTVTFKPYPVPYPVRTVTPDEALELLAMLGYPDQWKRAGDSDRRKVYATAALAGEVSRVKTSVNGTRNNTLNAAAFAVGTLVATGALDEAVAVDELTAAAHQAGLGERETDGTIKSGLGKGKLKPRTLPGTIPVPDYGSTRTEPTTPGETTTTPNTPPDVAEILRTAPLTSVGNAECLLAMHGPQLRYCHTQAKWLSWDGHRWAEDGDGRAMRLMLATIRARQSQLGNVLGSDKEKSSFASFVVRSENEHGLTASLSSASWQAGFATTIDQYDSRPMLANAGSVTIDLATGQTRDNDPRDFITRRLGADYDAGATCPLWRRLLGEWFNDDQAMIEYIARAVGYTLTGDTREQKLFLCHGAGANGKSVFLTTLSRLMGEYAASRSFSTFDADERNRVGDDLAGLKGARLVTVIETDEDRRLNEARVKSLTGQDTISCRFLFGEYFNFRPEFKLWIAVNHRPTVRGTDRGIWRRLQLIPFLQSFEGREDKQLDAKLRAELPGVLNWALDGLRDWTANGLNPPATVRDATEQYRADSDLLGQWLAACTARGKLMETKAGDAYKNYVAWAKETSTRPISFTSFGNAISERGIGKEIRGGKVFYAGIGLLSETAK